MIATRSAGRAVPRRARGPSTGRVIQHVLLVVIALLFLLPMIWVLSAAVDARASFAVHWPHFTLANFRFTLTADATLRPLWNSFQLAAGTTIVTTATGFAAAYALSRHRVRLTRSYLYVILFATGLPVQLLMIPAYTLFVALNLLDSIPATILFLSATSLPFAIWLLKNFIDHIPLEIDEAAQVDGASTEQRLRLVVLPLAAPGVAVAAMFTFLNAWGQFVIPYILLQSPDKLPAAVGIYQFLTANGRVQYGPLAAYTLIFSLPVLLLYGVLSRYFSGAFNFGGGVKG